MDDGHNHVHIFLNLNKPYLSEDRYQTEREVKEVDEGIRSALNGLKVSFLES